MKKKVSAAIFFIALGLDRLGKLWALSELTPVGEGAVLFSIALHFNAGISFSLLRGNPVAGLFLSCCALASATLLLCTSRLFRSSPGTPFLLAGIGGNLLDRLLYGHVVDWIYVGVYVNLADLWLCIGGLLLLVACLREQRAV